MEYTNVQQNYNEASVELERFCTVPLEDLARRIRDGHRAIQAARGLTLDQALDVGDAALAVKARVRSLKRWLNENDLVVSTTLLYAQLASHQDEIEAARKENPDFSLRDARKLITKRSVKEKTRDSADSTTNATLDVLTVLSTAPAAEISAALAKLGIDWLLKVIPAAMVAELTQRVARLPRANDEPFLRASEVLRRALGLVKIASDAATTPAVAMANEKEAIAALRQLNFVLAGAHIDHVTIVRQHAKANRCARGKTTHRAA